MSISRFFGVAEAESTVRREEAHWLIHLFAALFVLRYILLPYRG